MKHTINQINAMTESELDRAIAEAKGEKPLREWIVSNDGGKSLCASTDGCNGPWYFKSQLEAWLDKQHRAGQHIGYEILPFDIYKEFSTDPGAALALLCEMLNAGYTLKFNSESINGEATPESICGVIAKSWLAWKGME
jgi:hypothetical protein